MKKCDKIGIDLMKSRNGVRIVDTWPYNKFDFCIVHFNDLYQAITDMKAHRAKTKIYYNISLKSHYTYKGTRKKAANVYAILYDFVNGFIISHWNDLQEDIDPILSTRLGDDRYVPIYLQVDNDLTYDDLDEIIAYSQISSIDGLLVSNMRLFRYIMEHQKGGLKIIFNNPGTTAQAVEIAEMGAVKLSLHQKSCSRIQAYRTLKKFLPAIFSTSDSE